MDLLKFSFVWWKIKKNSTNFSNNHFHHHFTIVGSGMSIPLFWHLGKWNPTYGMGGGKKEVRPFVMEQQKGRETQKLLEVWMVIIFMFVHKPSFYTLYQTFVHNFDMVPKIYLNVWNIHKIALAISFTKKKIILFLAFQGVKM